jgi:hypothetical protein
VTWTGTTTARTAPLSPSIVGIVDPVVGDGPTPPVGTPLDFRGGVPAVVRASPDPPQSAPVVAPRVPPLCSIASASDREW